MNMDKFVEWLPDTVTDALASPLVLPIALIVVGVLCCFLGYRLIKVFIGLAGLACGFKLGHFVADFFLDNQIAILVISAAVALMLFFLAIYLYKAGIFVFCAAASGLIISAIPVPDGRFWQIVILAGSIVGGLLIGLISVKLTWIIVVLVSSAVGGLMISANALELLGRKNNLIFLIAGGVLFLIGAIVQFITTRKHH